jgi:outer membrane receptor protein involved in Fe transport
MPSDTNDLRAHARIWFAIAFIMLAAVGEAQNPRGSLRGLVLDTAGARVSGAQVHVQASDSIRQCQTQTDESGDFRFEDLLPGAYSVHVKAQGFADATSIVQVLISTTREIRVTLKPEGVQQVLNVPGQSSSITTQALDSSSTVHQAVVTVHDLQNIPLASRSFASIAYLAPGTEPVEPSDPTKARITAVAFGGSSGLNVELSVDGGDNSDDYIGGFLQNFSPDAIQEFSVRTDQEDADTSRTTGGSVVITTKHGTNEWHGTLGFYERATALNARSPIDNPAPDPKQPFSRQNYVGTIGGPIRKNSLWFFTSFENVRERASISYSPDSLAQFRALNSLATQGLIPGVSSISVPNSVPVPFRDYLGTVRLDWAQSQKSQWFLRAAVDNYTSENDLVQQATLPSTGATLGSNYLNLLLNQQYMFSPTWLGSFTFDASSLHHTAARNGYLGFALAFPFSATFHTISGFETFGDNQFATDITAFPVVRDQQKYQFRYDVSHASGSHAPKFGVNFIHEPVLGGALSGTAEDLHQFGLNPVDYVGNPTQFQADFSCSAVNGAQPSPGTTCDFTPAINGSFSQNVQRLGLYAQDSWRLTPRVTINYGLRYDTTFGLFTASGRTQLQNPAYVTLQALQVPLVNGTPHDYRKAFAPRLGIAYGPSRDTVIRAGVGLYYNDLAQNGWVTAFQALNSVSQPCVAPGVDKGCVNSGTLIDPHYKTPYALHASAGVQHSFNENWTLSVDWAHEQGVHAYRAYSYPGAAFTSPSFPGVTVPDINVYKTDNRSTYDAMYVHIQGNVSRHFNLIANYTLASARTWGCTVGELFDYVNGVCDPFHPFAPGDYGPSGEDVRHRFVLAGTFYTPGGFEISTLSQFESARPYTLTTPAGDRAVVNGFKTSLDQFRGTPYMQVDLRVSRPITFHDRWSVMPFIEFFNLFNRDNPGNNFISDISALPTPVNELANATTFCLNAACTQTQPITSLNQLRAPAGALGDFFGPGTTVGIPFAAQVGVRVNF